MSLKTFNFKVNDLKLPAGKCLCFKLRKTNFNMRLLMWSGQQKNLHFTTLEEFDVATSV